MNVLTQSDAWSYCLFPNVSTPQNIHSRNACFAKSNPKFPSGFQLVWPKWDDISKTMLCELYQVFKVPITKFSNKCFSEQQFTNSNLMTRMHEISNLMAKMHEISKLNDKDAWNIKLDGKDEQIKLFKLIHKLKLQTNAIY